MRCMLRLPVGVGQVWGKGGAAFDPMIVPSGSRLSSFWREPACQPKVPSGTGRPHLLWLQLHVRERYAAVHAQAHVQAHVRAYIYIYTYTRIHAYIYIYTHAYVYIYTHISMHVCKDDM